MVKGVIFDFDGVVVDTESYKFALLKEILKKHKYELKDEDFPDFIGKRTAFFLKQKFADMPEEVIGEVVLSKREAQYKDIEKRKLIPGIRDVLVFMKGEGYRTAIATGSELGFMKKILEFNSLEAYFDIIVSGDDFSNSKPHPDSFELALERLGLAGKDVVVIEDSGSGIRAAKKAGCRVFALSTYLGGDSLSEADAVFKNHLELLEYFKEKDL